MIVYMVVTKIPLIHPPVFEEKVEGLFKNKRLADVFAAQKKSENVHVVPVNLIESGSPEANKIMLGG